MSAYMQAQMMKTHRAKTRIWVYNKVNANKRKEASALTTPMPLLNHRKVTLSMIFSYLTTIGLFCYLLADTPVLAFTNISASKLCAPLNCEVLYES